MRYVETGIFPCGELTAVSDGASLVSVFRGGVQESISDEITNRAIEELHEYFRGIRREFDLPMNPGGTPFRRQVWDALRTVPYGATATYGDIARRVGNPKAARAVGGAVGANPILIMIPCHRIVGADGIGGFSSGIDMKEMLLQLEKQ